MRNRLKAWMYALLAPVALLPLGAPAANSAATGDAKVPIAIFVAGLTPFTQPALEAVKKEFAARAEFTVFDDGFNPQTQIAQCEQAVAARRFKGFVIYPSEGSSMVPCVKAAIAAGIKVASWNYPPLGPDPRSEVIQIPGQVGMDLLSDRVDFEAAVGLTLKACAGRDPCNVAMLIAAPTMAHVAMRRAQVLAALGKHHNVHIVVEHTTGFNAPDKAEAAVRSDLAGGARIDVVLGDDDVSLVGAEHAVAKAGKAGEIKLIGAGATANGVRAVTEGRWFGTVLALPVSGARTATRMVLDSIAGKPIERPVVINQLEQTVCPNAEVLQACASKFVAEW